MKTILILMDSLNRHYIEPYGGWVKTPAIDRLASRGIVFDKHYACSLPCMPARRDLMTGRQNFLDAPWGPIEPFDDCLPVELRSKCGTYSHLISDHYHYWEQNGFGYNTLFNTWEFIRGQEGDPWHPHVKDPEAPAHKGRNRRQDWVNRQHMDLERDEDYPTPQCFERAIDFLKRTDSEDNWFLQVEVFDPHEPFMCPSKYRQMYGDEWSRSYHFDWPNYAPVSEEEGEEAIQHIRKQYAGTVTMGDAWLGKFLQTMDELDAWKDTVLILTTDHGHMLGEHGYWAKNYMLVYEELAHIPLIVCAPGATPGRRACLSSALDIMPTLMELHAAELPPHVQGKSIVPRIATDGDHHDAVLFGYFGRDVNMTDGRYTYSRLPAPGATVYHHTALPQQKSISREALAAAETGRFLAHAYDMPLYRIGRSSSPHRDAGDFHPLYDLQSDPHQTSPIRDDALEARMASRLKSLLERHDAPECQYARLGL